MSATEEQFRTLLTFAAASSMEAAKSIVRQNPALMDAGALTVLDQVMAREKERGNMTVYNQLVTARQRLSQIQSGG